MSLAGPWSSTRLAMTLGLSFLVSCFVGYFAFNSGSLGEILTWIGLTLMSGFITYTGVQWLVSSRHRMLATLARNNLTRRKRNTALVVVGLLVGSAIVSSSLVIGDSLDATMEEQFLAPLGDTDYYIRGSDHLTGLPIEWNESRAASLFDELSGWNDIDGLRGGLSISTSIRHDGLGDPIVNWYAFNSTQSAAGGFRAIGGADGIRYADIEPGHVVINAELAESVDAGPGDEIEIHWMDISLEEGISRDSTNLTVQAVVDDVNTGHRNARQSLIFTPVDVAQSLTGKSDVITHLAIAVKGDGNDALHSRIENSVNEILVAEDAGLMIESVPSNGMFGVARTTGLGMLDVGEVTNLSAAVEGVGLDVSMTGLLQVPIYNIAKQGLNVSGLASASISTIAQSGDWDLYATSAGLSLQAPDGEWWIYSPDGLDDESVRDVLLLGPEHILAAHADGIRELNLTANAPDDDHLMGHDITALERFGPTILALELRDGQVTLHSSESDFDWTATALPGTDTQSASLAVDEDEIVVMLDGILGTVLCSGPAPDELICQVGSDLRGLFSHGDSTWITIGQTLHQFDANNTTEAWTLGLPNGTILAQDAAAIWVEGAGLWAWNGTVFEALELEIPSAATTEDAVFSLVDDCLIISTGTGVSILENGTLSGRLPSSIKVDVLNRLPLMVVAIEGAGMPGFEPVQAGRINVSAWAGETLALQSIDGVVLRGYLPAIRGQLDGERLVVDAPNISFPTPPGQDAFAAVTFGFVSISDAEALAGGGEGDRSMVIIAGFSMFDSENFTAMHAALEVWADEQADLQTTGLKVAPIKQNLTENTAQAGESFAMLFLIFGTFVIFAGILLVMNIFVMLADERKPEMGMARAIGMQRSDLRALFVQEGALLGLISSALGSLAGIGVAWALMQMMNVAFRDTLGWDVVFDWSVQSLLAGFVTGFIVTWVTLWLTSLWISRLNVVAAIRSIPIRFKGGLPWWSILITLFLGFSAASSIGLAFLVGDPSDGSRHASWTFGIFMLMLAMVPPAFWILGRVLPEDIQIRGMRLHRPVVLPRIILSILSVSMMLFGWKGDPISAEWQQGAFSFIVLGLFMVAAGVMLLTSLAPLAARAGARLLSPLSSRIASVLPTSLSYPLATPFRTAMTMGMFSLVVFAVVVLSGYSALFGNYIADLGDEAGGDFEILAFGEGIDGDLSTWNLGGADAEDFDGFAVISAGVINAERSDGDGDRLMLYVNGFDTNFTDHGALTLDVWAEELGPTQADAWQAVLDDQSLVIIDHSLTRQPPGFGVHSSLNLTVGSQILISDPTNSGINRTVYVAGILKQESSIFMTGIIMNASFAEERFDAEPTYAWFSLPEGTDAATQAALADEIERGMIEQGIAVFVIEIEFEKAQAFFLSMFNLLQAFLGLGLAVGIAGLAVVTIRNVSERRHQIGILRALGFQRGMVVAAFLVELSWVSFLGILNGALVGIGFHYSLYERFLKDDGAEFLMPWAEISAIIIGAYALTLIATVWPVLKAASIRPAEALRDVD